MKVKSKGALDREDAPNGYAVTVNVADSSIGEETLANTGDGRDSIIVLIRVLQEDEAPKFAVGDSEPPTTIEHVEVDGGTVLDTDLSNNYNAESGEPR